MNQIIAQYPMDDILDSEIEQQDLKTDTEENDAKDEVNLQQEIWKNMSTQRIAYSNILKISKSTLEEYDNWVIYNN